MVSCRMFRAWRQAWIQERAEGLQHPSGGGPGNPTQPSIPCGARLSEFINPTRKDAAAAKLCLVPED